MAILPLKEGSVSPKLLNLLFQKEISLSVIPLEILLRNTGSDSVFHNAVSVAEIPFAILALNLGSNSVIGPVNFSADVAKIAYGTLNICETTTKV